MRIDYFFTNKENKEIIGNEIIKENWFNSDHLPIICIIKNCTKLVRDEELVIKGKQIIEKIDVNNRTKNSREKVWKQAQKIGKKGYWDRFKNIKENFDKKKFEELYEEFVEEIFNLSKDVWNKENGVK